MRKRQDLHESYQRDEEVVGPSNRSFGTVFIVVFAIIGLAPLLSGGGLRWWSLAVAAVLLAVVLLAPKLLSPLNKVWLRFGLLLHRIVNPIIMGLMFYVVLTPLALALRVLGKDILRLRHDPSAETYWIPRDPPGPQPETMKNQF